MRIGILVIGDELLLGKRQDRHLPKMIEILGARGPAADVTPACAWLIARLGALGVRHEPGVGAGVP